MAKVLKNILKKSQGNLVNLKPEELDDTPFSDESKRKDHWGWHLLLDCSKCNKDIDQPKVVEKFLIDMVKTLKMKAIGKPVVVQFNDPNGPEGRGTTGFQIISTSHVSIHSDDEGWSAYIDIFSCKAFNPKASIQLIKKYFQPKHIAARFVYRDAGPWPKH